MVLAEALERRALLTAEITVLAPSDVNVVDGQTVDMNPLIGPVVQVPGRITQATFTIRNDGDTALSLGPAIVTGDFTVVGNPASGVAPGQTTTLVLNINTATAGTRSGTISIPNNDSDENPFDLRATVDVIAAGPDISVVNSAGTELVDGVTPINFGSVPQGQPGPTQTFTITNRGSLNLSLGPVTVPPGFTVTKPLGQGLGPGQQDTLTVQLDSGVVGTRAGVISIPNNDPTASPFDIPVTGTVVAATPAEIAVQSGSTNLVNGTTTVNFGTVGVGQAAPTRTFTVTNQGGSNLSLGSVFVPPGFTITEQLNALLTPGTSDTFTVQMDSSVAGAKSGTIRIPNSDTDENPFNIPVAGTVSGIVIIGPSIAVQTDTTQLVNGATTVDFGTVTQGEIGPTRTFTVANQGTTVLTLGPVTVPTGYTVTEPLAVSLDPGTSDTFTVTLDSTVVGTKTGSISILNNDPAQNPFNIPVTGTVSSSAATGPEIAVRTDSTDLVNGTTPVAFGTAIQGSAGTVRTFTVSNTGTATLTLGAVTVPIGLTVLEPLTTSLAPGASDTLTVQMNTTTVGPLAGAIFIQNNDPNENPFSIPVTGAVVSATPEVAVTVGTQQITSGVTQVNFGTIGVGQQGPVRTFVVTNQGGVPLTLGTVAVPDGYTLTDGLATTLAPGASDSFTVQLNSTTVGTKAGTVRFATNDPNENPFSIPVTGNVSTTPVVVGPEIVVRQGTRNIVDGATLVSFGNVSQGAVGPTRTFTVTNAGTESLNLGTVTVPAGFTLTEGLNSTLAPGESDSFTVQLNSAVAGTRTGAIRFTNNDPDENPFNIPVTGTVLAIPSIDLPQISVRTGVTQLTDGTTQVNFGRVGRGQPGISRTFTVTNTGAARLTLGTVVVPAGFTLIEGLDSALAPGESDTFSVRLNSTTLGTKSGMVRFINNDTRATPFNIPVTGRVVSGSVPSPGPEPSPGPVPGPVPGTSPEVVIRLGGRSVVDGGTTAIKFGSVTRGQVGQMRTFRVTNTGTAPLTLGKVRVPAGFKLVEGLNKTLAPGKSDTFTVRLKSGSVGAKAGTITIATNDSDESTFEIAVTGRVRAHKVAPKSLLADLFSQRLIEDVG